MPIDNRPDEPHRVVGNAVIVNRLGQQEQLGTIMTENVVMPDFTAPQTAPESLTTGFHTVCRSYAPFGAGLIRPESIDHHWFITAKM